MPDTAEVGFNYQLGLRSDYALGTEMMIGGYLDFYRGDGASENAYTRCVGEGELHQGVGVNFTYVILQLSWCEALRCRLQKSPGGTPPGLSSFLCLLGRGV